MVERISAADDDDPLISPLQATVLHILRRSLAISLAVAENYAEATGLAELRRNNLSGSLPSNRKAEFTELLNAEALAATDVFANTLAFLIGPHSGETNVEVGEVE